MKNCNKCGLSKNKSEFPIQRRGKKYQSMSGYCQKCRKRQMYDNLNTNVDKFLSDKYHRTKTRAKKIGVEFDLEKDYFISLFHKQNGKCFYTGVVMDWKVGFGKSRNSISVDKIIPDKGYTKGNIVFCANRINTIKYDLTLDELKKYIPKWYKKITNYLTK